MLGNIQFIGQLYIKKMLTERIMHECIVKLLGEVRGTTEEQASKSPDFSCNVYLEMEHRVQPCIFSTRTPR
jgi:hypothetical protein